MERRQPKGKIVLSYLPGFARHVSQQGRLQPNGSLTQGAFGSTLDREAAAEAKRTAKTEERRSSIVFYSILRWRVSCRPPFYLEE